MSIFTFKSALVGAALLVAALPAHAEKSFKLDIGDAIRPNGHHRHRQSTFC